MDVQVTTALGAPSPSLSEIADALVASGAVAERERRRILG